MAFQTPADIKIEFRDHPRRALILTTVVCESRAVKAHLAKPERLVGEKGALYEYGYFSDPAGDWLVVHAITSQGNSDAGLVTGKAFQEFGSFHAVMFVGVAGSLKEDIPIGSVVVGDYVYNGHAAKVGDNETFSRPHGLPSARELLTAAQGLIYDDEWWDLVRPPVGTSLPDKNCYPCEFPPSAVVKGIVSGEEVVAGDKSPRFAWLRVHFNDCGAVEMEGWGVMNAAHHENASAIIVRGISDMCAGKDQANDKMHQPIAAAHAAAFAFSILSFRSKVPTQGNPSVEDTKTTGNEQNYDGHGPAESRTDFVFNFAGSIEDWPKEKVDAVVERLKVAFDDEKLTLVRVDVGSVRLVMSVRESDLGSMNLATLREVASESGVFLLGATSIESVGEADKAKVALATASVDLLAWEKTLPNGRWIERPERENIETRFQLDTSSTVLLGEPGSGKSALLSKITSELLGQGATVFALKADFISTEVRTELDLQRELNLPALPSDLVLRLAALQPVYVLIDQLDALASQLDLRSGRLNVLLNLVRRISNVTNIHVILSARTFEFNHDVRLRTIEAEAVRLSLPPWHEVKERLAEVGIDSDTWPESARDVVRIPQALKTFIGLVGAGRTEPFSTYQAMLEQLWHDRIASADDSEPLILLASDLAGQMAEEESLWLAASRFDNRLNSLNRLEALGFLVRSENSLSVAFSHQTVFDYVLARSFVRNTGLLSTYVQERQDSLFVRAKLWSALNYLREAEVTSYVRELTEIWMTKDLRRHLRLLLIEFLGQVNQPQQAEKRFMSDVMNSPDLRIFGLKAIGSGTGWFSHFASTAIWDAMSGTDPEAGQASRILALNWNTHCDQVVRLIKDRWLPYPAKDNFTWMTVQGCPQWSDEVEELAITALKRAPISVWAVEHTAMTLAVTQPVIALRLVRAKLDFLLVEAQGKPEPPPSKSEKSVEYEYVLRPRLKALEGLLETMEWGDIPSLSETVPSLFLEHVWSWYVAVFSEILGYSCSSDDNFVYPGRYILEVELGLSPQSPTREKPVMMALQIAVETLAKEMPETFLEWADENSTLEILAVQQLIARGYEVAAGVLASRALDWLLSDQRRFQLGNSYGHRSTTVHLVSACTPHWSTDEITRFQESVRSYKPSAPDHLHEPSQRKTFLDVVRASKKELLEAVGLDRLAPENRELVANEQRALGDRFGRSFKRGEVCCIGSPMDSSAMAKAKDRDILKIFREIPDKTHWDHPTHWMRGGNIQLSRAFAEFAKTYPARAMRLMEQFEPLQQERAAGYALDAMAEDAQNDKGLLDAFRDLHDRGFKSEDFRDSAARALEKIANRKGYISHDVIDILIEWLSLHPSQEEGTDNEELKVHSALKDEELSDGSILWGYGNTSFLPGGNYNSLSALASILLSRKEEGRDRYLSILNDHLSRETNPKVWKGLLHCLNNAGGSTPEGVSAFLRKLFNYFPEILATRDAVFFLAHAQRWDDQLVFDLIIDWSKSDRAFLQRAYGELVGLVATAKGTPRWECAREEIIVVGTESAKIGLAYASVNLWTEAPLRLKSTETLVALLKGASKDLVAAVMDVFRLVDDFVPDEFTVRLLRALADDNCDMTAAPSSFVVERLQALLPHEDELIATIAEKLIVAWRSELGDIRTGTAIAAPQLTDLALTLHRLGGTSRQSGVAIFEAMIQIDAYGACETLAEIDGRFGSHQAAARQRLAHRRRPSCTKR
ncbi:hypothetical protein KP001_06210 [Geomonas subterranea]|uniref:Nucleoside phosphorylase domain-containing protein n=1 Tax=Geomonas subterranea TaxID=2847989 RepID=A0ABX8LJC6_9BACT|nr:hypothetical protein [Geomonas subterranea]QXE92118.1 hypothetical protein KP001_06210 [Geomonas subterranea]QXM09786.1 hypothetical protein KP002_01285 [Geomonas subterranea]